MGNLNFGTALVGVGLVGGAIALAITNPDEAAYKAYAVEQLQTRLSQDLCNDAPSFLSGPCETLVNNSNGTLNTIVETNTTRRNFYLLSVYETNLDPAEALSQLLPSGLSAAVGGVEGVPSYRAETVGILGQFFTYRAEQQ